LVALVVEEATSSERRRLLAEDPQVVTWWASRVECASALARLTREGKMSVDDLAASLDRLERLASSWAEVEPRESVRRRALRLLRVHELRAADALQLAAALAASREEPASMAVVSSDARLSTAARTEGFSVC
jgi:predicted nucleic acid-binding protein